MSVTPVRRLLLLCGLGIAGMSDATDLVEWPDAERSFERGPWRLRVLAGDLNAQPFPLLELSRRHAAGWVPVWQAPSLARWGPRHVLLGPAGGVVAVDSMYRSRQTAALVVYDPQGRVLRQVQVDELPGLVGASMGDILDGARQGTWAATVPAWTFTDEVVVGVAGRSLKISLDGAVRVR